MRILVVHQYYLAANAPGGSRFNELARLWKRAGHEVTVIAGTLDYVTGKTAPEYRGVWLRKEDDDGIEVWRCHVAGSYSKGYVGRAFAFGGFTFAAMHAALRAARPDVVIATSPPLVTVVPGWLAARRANAPWVFEVRDLWPESAVTTGVLSADGPVTQALYSLERWACSQADCINVLTPAFQENIVKRGLADASKIVFVPNGADLDAFRPAPPDERVRAALGWTGRYVVMYAGAHGRANALRQLIDAAELLREHPEILIATVGDGPERQRLAREAASRGLRNIVFCGAQPKERMPDVVNACDVGAAVLQNNPTFRTVYPNKVFDYMACEKPVLLAIDGAARKLVCDEAKAGVFAEPENARAIADAILALRADPVRCQEMGASGRDWVLHHAGREALAEKYATILDSLIRARGSKRR